MLARSTNSGIMAGDETDSDWDDTTDRTDRSLITDISETIAYLSPQRRASRRKQRLREELVRAQFGHQVEIEQQDETISKWQTLVNKITGAA